MNKHWILLPLLAWACGAGAQQVWRCGNSYGDQPCPGGTSVSVAPAVTAEDTRRANAAAQVDMQRAAALEKARLEQEKGAPKAIVIKEPEASKPATAARKEPAPFTVVGPKPKK